MNFITVLNHSLYVSLILIALTTDIVSIIQQASFGGVDSQALLTSDNYGNDVLDLNLEIAKLNDNDVTGYRNASFGFTSSPQR